MYIPTHFEERDAARIAELIDRYAFGLLVTTTGDRPYGSHVPFLREADGRLLCHLARANPQTRQLDGTNVMAVITGPNAYISPTWYESPGVPTWNYAAVHVYGRAELIHSKSRLRDIVERLTAVYEASEAQPWAPRYEESKLDFIVGVEIFITEIQGKFKLSQNRSPEDQSNVIDQLRSRGSDNSSEVAALMTRNRELR